jgi:hypothetical protein
MAPPRSRRRLTSLHECILPLRAQKHIRSALVQRLLPCLPRRPPSLGKLSDCNLTSWLYPSCPIFIISSPAIPTTSKSRSPDRPNLPIQSSLYTLITSRLLGISLALAFIPVVALQVGINGAVAAILCCVELSSTNSWAKH